MVARVLSLSLLLGITYIQVCFVASKSVSLHNGELLTRMHNLTDSRPGALLPLATRSKRSSSHFKRKKKTKTKCEELMKMERDKEKKEKKTKKALLLLNKYLSASKDVSDRDCCNILSNLKDQHLLELAKSLHKQEDSSGEAQKLAWNLLSGLLPSNKLQGLSMGIIPGSLPKIYFNRLPETGQIVSKGFVGGMNQGGVFGGGINQGGYSNGGMDQGGYSNGGMDQGGYSNGGMDQGGYSIGGMDQGGFSNGGMYQDEYSNGGMNQGGIYSGGMNQGGIYSGGMNQGGIYSGGMGQGGFSGSNQGTGMNHFGTLDQSSGRNKGWLQGSVGINKGEKLSLGGSIGIQHALSDDDDDGGGGGGGGDDDDEDVGDDSSEKTTVPTRVPTEQSVTQTTAQQTVTYTKQSTPATTVIIKKNKRN